MRKLLVFSMIAFLGGLLIKSSPIRAQDVDKNEKKVTIKTVTDVDGKKVVSDTTFVITDDMDSEELKKMGIFSNGEELTIDLDVDSDGKMNNKKVIVIKDGEVISSGGDHDTYFLHSDGKGKGKHKVVKWISEDGEEMTIEVEAEIERAMAELEKAHHEMDIDIEIIDGEHIILMKEFKELEGLAELAELEVLKELDGLHELNDFRFEFIEAPHAPEHPSMYFSHENKGKVSDVELRDAGIKNKQDRLDASEIQIEVKAGVVDFYFTLKGEGSPKLTVYNVYGDKVISAKPEQINNKYSQRIDLSKKQYGTYYFQVEMGNSSFTEKVRL